MSADADGGGAGGDLEHPVVRQERIRQEIRMRKCTDTQRYQDDGVLQVDREC